MLTPEEIKKLRKTLGLSAREFAEKLGVHIDTVFKWESGDRHPTYNRMIDINKLADKVRKQPA